MNLSNPKDPEAAKAFFREVIEEGKKHRYYQRTVDVANFAWDMLTGEGERLEEQVRSIRPHETDDQKAQRVRVNNPLTPFSLNQVVSVFRKTRRAEGIRFVWDHKTEKAREELDKVFGDFYANQDLKSWAFDAFEYYTFWDPNAFFVVESVTEEDGQKWFYPFEVRSEEAIFYEHKNGDLQYLIVRQIEEVEVAGSTKKRKDFYFYGVGFALHYKEIVEGQDDTQYLSEGYQYEGIEPKDGGDRFLFKMFETGIKTLNVFSFGVFRDGQTKRNTFVTPFEPARFLLKDMVRDKSLDDLSTLVHNFPQKLVYGPKCEYESPEMERCDWGYIGGDHKRPCPNCDGKGILTHTTEQDVIILALPESNEGFFPLSQLIHYATQSEWLPKFQADKLERLVQKVFLAVFQTEVYNQAQVRSTATEKLLEWDKVYDTLEPYAVAIAKTVPLAASVIAEFIEVKTADFSAAMYVPRDFKMRGEPELLALLQSANNADAIPEVREAISIDLLGRFYRNNPDEIALIKALRYWLPWKDRTFDQAFAIVSGRAPTDPDRIFWENFDQISRAVRETTKDRFHKFPLKRQREMIDDEIKRYQERIIPVELPPILGPVGSSPQAGSEPGQGGEPAI